MRVGLFVTCLVDLMRPSIGFAALKLLENAGYEVTVPAMQTCCGQPGWNSGDREAARALAERLIAQFEECRYVVVPSGSSSKTSGKCARIIPAHEPEGTTKPGGRSEEHTSELQSRLHLVCRLLLEKK